MHEAWIESEPKRVEVYMQRAQSVEALAKLKIVGQVVRRRFEKQHDELWL
jgi:hypothetical protein